MGALERDVDQAVAVQRFSSRLTGVRPFVYNGAIKLDLLRASRWKYALTQAITAVEATSFPAGIVQSTAQHASFVEVSADCHE
jgi:hypothetical protein